jgi:hypothetical protein
MKAMNPLPIGQQCGTKDQTKRAVRPSALALGVSLLLLLTLSIVAWGCGGGGGSKAVDPKTVLQESSAAMKKIEGFHFVYKVDRPGGIPSKGTSVNGIAGDVNREGSMTATIDLSLNGVFLQIGFIAIGDTQYVQDPLSKKWQSVSVQDSPVGKLNLNAGTIQILDRITSPTYVGMENVAGASTYHIKGMVTAQELAAIAGAVTSTGTFPTDLWIGTNDKYVYQVQIVGAAQPDEDPAIRRTITLSNLNKPVTVKAPQ